MSVKSASNFLCNHPANEPTNGWQHITASVDVKHCKVNYLSPHKTP